MIGSFVDLLLFLYLMKYILYIIISYSMIGSVMLMCNNVLVFFIFGVKG